MLTLTREPMESDVPVALMPLAFVNVIGPALIWLDTPPPHPFRRRRMEDSATMAPPVPGALRLVCAKAGAHSDETKLRIECIILKYLLILFRRGNALVVRIGVMNGDGEFVER